MHEHKRPTAAATTAARPQVRPWCSRDPDRWTTTVDEGAKALCRACPLRWRCAKAACETPAAEGIWAGILIPETGRGRQFALRQLRSLAEQNGYPVPKDGIAPAGARMISHDPLALLSNPPTPTSSTSAPHVFRYQKRYAATPEKVWESLVSDESLAAWGPMV